MPTNRDEIKALVRDEAYGTLAYWIEMDALPALSEARTESALARARALVGSSDSQFRDLLKIAIDRADLETFQSALKAWRDTLGDRFLLADSATQSELAQVDHARRYLEFGLTLWAGHMLAAAAAPEEIRVRSAIWIAASNRLRDPLAIRECLSRSQGNDRDWSRWLLRELPEGEAHFLPTGVERIRTAILLALCADPYEPEDSPFPDEMLLHQYSQLVGALEELKLDETRWATVALTAKTTEPKLTSRLSEPEPSREAEEDVSFGARVKRVEEVLEIAPERAQERARSEIRRSPLNPARVAEFEESLRDSLRESRPVRHVLHELKALTLDSPSPLDDQLGLRQFIPKRWFVVDPDVHFILPSAGGFTKPIRKEESARLFKALASVEPQQPSSDAIHQMIWRATERLQRRGFSPSLLVAPVEWRLRIQADTALLRSGGSTTETEQETRARELWMNRLTVVGIVGGPPDRVYVLDAAEALEFTEWGDDREAGIKVDIKSFDASRAEEYIRERPEFVAEVAEFGSATEYLQEHVILSIEIEWQLTSRNPAATEAVALPTR